MEGREKWEKKDKKEDGIGGRRKGKTRDEINRWKRK